MANSYHDRLAGETFRGDVEWEVRLQPDARDEGQVARQEWVSEQLIARLRHLGIAYNLPLLSRLPDTGQVVYPEVQLPVLEDELAFLFDLISDPVLLQAALPIRDLIGHAKQNTRGWFLVVETP